MQAVRSGSTRAYLMQSTSPKRCCAAPSRTDVVLHHQFVLHKIRVRPDLLVRIAWHQLSERLAIVGTLRINCLEVVGVLHIVRACGPTWTMALCTSDLFKEFLALLDGDVVDVAGSRHSQATMPNHEVDVVVIRHFYGQVGRSKVVVDICLHIIGKPLRMFFGIRNLADVIGKSGLYLRILRSAGGIDLSVEVQIVIPAVRTCHIGDVPDGIGTSSIKNRATRHGVGIATHILRAITLTSIAIKTLPLAVLKPRAVPMLQVACLIGCLLALPLRSNRVIGDGIGNACAIDSDGVLKAHLIVGCGSILIASINYIDGLAWKRNLWIDEAVRFPIRELVAPLVGITYPLYGNLGFVEWILEGRNGMALRHSC